MFDFVPDPLKISLSVLPIRQCTSAPVRQCASAPVHQCANTQPHQPFFIQQARLCPDIDFLAFLCKTRLETISCMKLFGFTLGAPLPILIDN